MKLVEILARELMEWPEHHGTNAISQDRCGLLNRLDRGCNPKEAAQVPAGSGTWPSLNWTRFYDLELSETADDWKTAIITREMWEAERARIKREKAMPKPNKDGWIRHRGGKCPVEKGTMVDVRYRDGSTIFGVKALADYDGETDHEYGWDAYSEFWSHYSLPGDIMAWRPHKPDIEALIQEGIDSADAGKLTPISEVRAKWVKAVTDKSSDVEMPAAKYFDGPIQWRDRIREIDATAIALNEERASLVAKLKAEGFVLIQSDEQNSVAESAHQDIAQQDMSDPANWRVGDKLVKISGDSLSKEGYIATLTKIEGERIYTTDECGGDSWVHIDDMLEDYAFHSRPPQ